MLFAYLGHILPTTKFISPSRRTCGSYYGESFWRICMLAVVSNMMAYSTAPVRPSFST